MELHQHKTGFKPLQLVALFALLQVAVAFLTNAGSFTHEESMWHYIGRNWFRLGLVPYEGGVDNKSPLIFSVFGLSDRLFGLNYWFPRVVGIVVQSAGVYFIYKIAMRLGDNRAAVIAVTIYGLTLLWRTTGGKLVSFTETYAVTFLIIAVHTYLCAVTRKHFFVSGLLTGLALGWRITAVFGAVALLIHAMSGKRKTVVPFVAGIITSVVVLLLLAVAAGIDPQQLYLYMLVDNWGERSTTDHSLMWRLERFAGNFIFSELALFYPPVIGYLFLKKRYSLLVIWLVCEFAGINLIGIYARPHFKHLLPVLCLVSGLSLSYFIQRYQFRWSYVLVIVWIVFFPKITEPYTSVRDMFRSTAAGDNIFCGPPYSKPVERAEEKLGRWIKENTADTDLVLVAGFGARVQLFSERLSPTIYFNVTQTERARQRLQHDISRNPPAMVLIPLNREYDLHVRPEIRTIMTELIKDRYRLEGCKYGYEVYSLNSVGFTF
ncbi:MAG TPA: glycosyltransferase family 39 protein [Chitinophagaceae bacterium]|nr:glycosyltransferase family 39 protein [Chitinophagaceae bacterium]